MLLLGSVSLLEWVWPCWRKCVTVGVGFEVSYAQDTANVSVNFLLLQGIGLSVATPVPHLYACCHTLCRDDKGLNL